MARNGVYRLDFSAIARRRPCVYEQGTASQVVGQLRRRDDVVRSWSCIVIASGRPRRQAVVELAAATPPCGQAAVEDAAVRVTDPLEHPPQASGNRPSNVVVDDNAGVCSNAHALEPYDEVRRVWEWMPPLVGQWPAGKILVEVRIARPGNVPVEIRMKACVRRSKVETAIHRDDVVMTDRRRKLCCVDQYGMPIFSR